MLFTVGLLILLYVYVIVRAIQFFVLPGPARDDDKIVGTTILTASLMFIAARLITYVNNPAAIQANSTSTALWVGFGLLNAMLYLGLLHRMIACRSAPSQRRHRPIHAVRSAH